MIASLFITDLFLGVLPEPCVVVDPPAVDTPLVDVGPQLALPPLDDLADVPDLDESPCSTVSGNLLVTLT